jgi:HEAT repeat protein
MGVLGLSEIQPLLQAVLEGARPARPAALRALVRLPLDRDAWLAVSRMVVGHLDAWDVASGEANDEPILRTEWVDAAGFVPTSAVRERLRGIAALPSHPHRRVAARALARVKDAAAIPALADLLRDDSVMLRQEAADALSRLSEPDAARALRMAHRRDRDDTVRFWAAVGIARIGDARPLRGELMRIGLGTSVPEGAAYEGDPRHFATLFAGHGPFPPHVVELLARIADGRLTLLDRIRRRLMAVRYRELSSERWYRAAAVSGALVAEQRAEPQVDDAYDRGSSGTEVPEERRTTAAARARELMATMDSASETTEIPLAWDDSEMLRDAPPELARPLVTRLFSRTARSEHPSILGNEIVLIVDAIGERFEPDIDGLFEVYRVARSEDLRWQIAWTISRDVQGAARLLSPQMAAADTERAEAAARLLEQVAAAGRQAFPPLFGGGSAPADVVPEVLLLDEALNADETAEREPRYTLVQIATTKATEAKEPDRVLDDDEPLEVGTSYAVSVWIDTKLGGVPTEGPARGIEDPGQAGTVAIAVLATSADFDIEEPVGTLRLPPDGASVEAALFRVRPRAPRAEAELRFHLLYSLNMIEDVLLVARVAAQGEGTREPRSLRLRYAPIAEFAALAALPPKQMHIHISRRADNQYVFFFVVEVENHRLVFNGKAPARLSEHTLASDLVAVRKALLQVALSRRDAVADGPPGAAAAETAVARALARAGRRLWARLFLAEKTKAMHEIGTWLADRHLERGALIQVTVDEAAADFVFPWALLYDRKMPESDYDPIDPDAVWGLRYVIEQHLPPIKHRERVESDFVRSERAVGEIAAPLVTSLFVGNVREVAEHEGVLRRLADVGALELRPAAPLRKRGEAIASLENSDADLLWFLTHGHTARPETAAHGGLNVEDWVKVFEAIPPAQRGQGWQGPYDRIKEGLDKSDEAWIQLAEGRITLPDLDELPRDAMPHVSLVFLNMCESAQIVPTLAGGFVDVFMHLGALTVIGTETSVPPAFAHPFALRVLRSFLQGVPIGSALLEARRAYADVGDLLGLAYTLYGSGRLKVTGVRSEVLAQAMEISR